MLAPPCAYRLTGVTRIVIATQREEARAHLAAAKARDDAAAIFSALPHTLLFSTPAPSVPFALSTRDLNTAGGAGGQFAPDGRDACWTGSPVRHHVAALTALLALRSETLPSGSSGSTFFLDFVRAHWRKLGRHASSEGHEGEPVLDVRLSLHSKLAMLDPIQIATNLVQFNDEVDALTCKGGGISLGGASSEKLDEVYAMLRATMGGVMDRERDGRRGGRRRRRGGTSVLSFSRNSSTAASDDDDDDARSTMSGWTSTSRTSVLSRRTT